MMRRHVLMIALALVASVSYSQPPTSSTAKSIQQPPAQSKGNAQQPASQQQGTRASPLIVETLTGPKTKEASDQDERERKEKSPNDWWTAGATVWLAIVTTILAFATFLLWKSTRDLVRKTSETARQQLRAYISITKAYAVWPAEEKGLSRPVTIAVRFKNSGQTPAHKVTSWMGVDSTTEKFEFPARDASGSVAVQGPGQTSEMSRERDIVDQIERWKSGEESLYVWGEIEYVDAFKEKRLTKFRFVMPKEGMHETGGRFRPCPDGNEAT